MTNFNNTNAQQGSIITNDYLNNVNATLYLAKRYLKTPPPASRTDWLIQKMEKYRSLWKPNVSFSSSYIKHINNVINYAWKSWFQNQSVMGTPPESEINSVNKGMALELAGGILNLQSLIFEDAQNGCLEPREYQILCNTLNQKNGSFVDNLTKEK